MVSIQKSMNVDVDGNAVFIERMTNETDAQLLARKDFILRPVGRVKTMKDEDWIKRINLSRFFHNVNFKGCAYDRAVYDRLNE